MNWHKFFLFGSRRPRPIGELSTNLPLGSDFVYDTHMNKTLMPKLTPSQCDDLISQYAELCVDSMDHQSMYQFIEQTLTEDFEKLTEHELFDEIRMSFDDETLDELVDKVTDSQL